MRGHPASRVTDDRAHASVIPYVPLRTYACTVQWEILLTVTVINR